jgi:putative endonuclease
MPYYVYILYSNKSNHYYIGSSSDPEKRLLRHNAGATPSTKPGRPWQIVSTETLGSETEAIHRELYLKSMKNEILLFS